MGQAECDLKYYKNGYPWPGVFFVFIISSWYIVAFQGICCYGYWVSYRLQFVENGRNSGLDITLEFGSIVKKENVNLTGKWQVASQSLK